MQATFSGTMSGFGNRTRGTVSLKQSKLRGKNYDIEVVRKNPSEVFEETEPYEGGYKVREKNADEIAKITRVPGTNKFHVEATGKKAGTIHIDFDHLLNNRPSCDNPDCYNSWKGLVVHVRQIGSIVNVYIQRDGEPDH